MCRCSSPRRVLTSFPRPERLWLVNAEAKPQNWPRAKLIGNCFSKIADDLPTRSSLVGVKGKDEKLQKDGIYSRGCPLCDASVYSYCDFKIFHDACWWVSKQSIMSIFCWAVNQNFFFSCGLQAPQCQYTDCSFLNANTCDEHQLITKCCCYNPGRKLWRPSLISRLDYLFILLFPFFYSKINLFSVEKQEKLFLHFFHFSFLSKKTFSFFFLHLTTQLFILSCVYGRKKTGQRDKLSCVNVCGEGGESTWWFKEIILRSSVRG